MFVRNWWDYFETNPYETVGRFVPSAFGHLVIVELSRVSWAYLDWIVDRQGGDYGEFFSANDRVRLPEKETIHEKMESAVRTLYLRREKAGSPRPEWCPPANAADFMDI